MKNKHRHIFIIFLAGLALFVTGLLLPGQASASYKITYDGTSFIVDSLSTTVDWNALGQGSETGVKPSFSLNGTIKQYDYNDFGFSTLSNPDLFVLTSKTVTLSTGENTFSFYSNNWNYDGCGCSAFYDPYTNGPDPDSMDAFPTTSYPSDGIYAKITFAGGQTLITNASNWQGTNNDIRLLDSDVNCTDENYNGYVQTKACGNCCYTAISKKITVANAPVNGGWSAWSTKNTSCGYSGTQTRTCTNPTPAYGGATCSGSATQAYTNAQCLPTASCSVPNQPYGGNPGITLSSTYGYYCQVYNDWSNVNSGYFSSGTYYPGAQTTPGAHAAQVYCYNTDWVGSGWNYCSYNVANAPVNGGWSAWSAINPACGYSGTQNRTCTNPTPQYGGTACSGPSTQAYTNAACLSNITSLFVSPNPIPYGNTATISYSCTNGYYSRIILDGSNSPLNDSGYFGSRTTTMPAQTIPGFHSVWAYCYNPDWVPSANSWYIIPYTVNAAPTLTLSAAPNPVAYNAASTLSWAPTNATSCWASNGWTGWKTVTGGSESTGALMAAKTYSLECWNSAGASTGVKTVTVNVIPPAPTLTLSATPNPVAYNAASTLNWTVSNATWCWASNGWTGWKSTTGGGEGTGPLTAIKVYTLECGNAGPNTVTRSVTINVNAPANNASCNSITAPTSVVAGQSFIAAVAMNNNGTKAWNSDASPHRLGSYDSTNGTTDNMRWGLNRVGLPSNVNPGGSATFNFMATAPTTLGSYSFDWKMVEDSIEWFGAPCTKTISVTAPPTPVTTFTSSSLSLPAGGGNITLNWSVAGAVPGTCTGYGGAFTGSGKATSGSQIINVPATTTFNLDCWNTVVNPWIPAVRISVTVNVCVPTCNEAGTHCPGVVYNDSCGNPTCNNGTLPQICGDWQPCSESCGGGTQYRDCACPPESESQGCSAQPCPPGYREVAPW